MKNNQLVRQLHNPKFDNDLLLGKLKSDSKSISDFKRKIKPALKHPYVRHVLNAKALPKNLEEIKKVRAVYTTENLTGEIGWLLHEILKNQEHLEEYNSNRLEFEKAVLLGDYKKAEEILDKIEKEICFSIWGVHSRFLLKNLQDGEEANWQELSEKSKETNDSLLLFMLENYSKRSELKLSYARYQDLVSNSLDGLQFSKFVEYLYFKLDYSSLENYNEFSFFISIDSNTSIIDRYNTLVNIVIEGLRTDSVVESTLEIWKSTFQELKYFKNDPRISCLNRYLTGDLKQDKASKEFIFLCDSYTSGKYERALSLSAEMIVSQPGSIEPYEIYVKTLIMQGKGFVKSQISENVDRILAELFDVISKSERGIEAKPKLYKLSSLFQDFHIGKQILSLANKYLGKSQKSGDFLCLMFSSYDNPRLISHKGLKEEVQNRIKANFENLIPDSLTVAVITSISQGDLKAISMNKDIAESRMPIYQARAMMKNKSFNDLISSLEALSDVDLNEMDKGEKYNLLYYSFIETSRFYEALQLYVQKYLNPEETIHTSTMAMDVLRDHFEDGKVENAKRSIDLPVFLKIANVDSYTQYVALDDFLTAQGVNRPSEIDISVSGMEPVVIFFLYEVCRVDTLQYLLEFESLEEVEEERQQILKLLLAKNPENEAQYIKEIAELTQGANIRKAIREVNKGRITINVPQLKNIESSSVQEGFLRYKELSQYSKKNKGAVGVDITSSSLTKYIRNLLEEHKQQKDDLVADPAFISFKSMFLDLRDKYLLSKEYGLDGYLSTRIRHGTLENHIRSIFENYNLISERTSLGNYNDVKYWDEKLQNFPVAVRTEFQEIVKTFSEEIDNQITYIIQELIQVYTEKYNKKPHGFFNYNFSKDLYLIYASSKEELLDHNAFIQYVFDLLQTYTESLLKKIRIAFKTELKNRFLEILDAFQKRVNGINGFNHINELNSVILNCRTEIQNELERISEWFYLSNPGSNSISDIMTTLKTSVEITNSISPNHQISPIYTNDLDLKTDGSIHLIYISRILLDNIIKHSGQKRSRISAEIGAELTDTNSLRLKFSNELADSINIESLKKTLEKVKEKWLDKDNFEMTNVEGGSGFEKIRRILAFDLKSRDYNFDFVISGNNLTILIDIHLTFDVYEV